MSYPRPSWLKSLISKIMKKINNKIPLVLYLVIVRNWDRNSKRQRESKICHKICKWCTTTTPNSKTKPASPAALATNKASWACQTTPDNFLANGVMKTPRTSIKVNKRVLVRRQNSKVISQIKINLKDQTLSKNKNFCTLHFSVTSSIQKKVV